MFPGFRSEPRKQWKIGNLISVAIKWVGWVRVDAKNVKFPKYWIWTKSSLAGNNKGHVTYSLLRNSLFGSYWSSDS